MGIYVVWSRGFRVDGLGFYMDVEGLAHNKGEVSGTASGRWYANRDCAKVIVILRIVQPTAETDHLHFGCSI